MMLHYSLKIEIPRHLEPCHPRIQVKRSDPSQTHLYISFGVAPSEHPSAEHNIEDAEPSFDVGEAICSGDVAKYPVSSVELTLPWKSLRCDVPGREKALSNQHTKTLDDMPDRSLLRYPTPSPTDGDTPPPPCCPPQCTTMHLASSTAHTNTPSVPHLLPEHMTPQLPHPSTYEGTPSSPPTPPHHRPGSTTSCPTLHSTNEDTLSSLRSPPASITLYPRPTSDRRRKPHDRDLLLDLASPLFREETPAPQIVPDTEDTVALGQPASTLPVSTKSKGLRNPDKRTLQSNTDKPRKRRFDVGEKIAQSFSSAIRAGGRIYKKDSSAFKVLKADLRLLEPDRSKATFRSFFTAQVTYADALQCRGVVASMVYSWCLIAVEYYAASFEYNTSSEYSKFMMAPVSKQDRRKAKFGVLILQIMKRISLTSQGGTHAYKICPAIACKNHP